jgi:chemotaxis protein MotB
LARAAVPIIGEIADILQSAANPIQVEGFTDNNPINTPRFPSNWELSAARAASVVHLLDRYGIQPDRMSAIGYGEYKPIADNDTEEGRQKNRRVVLVVLGRDNSRRNLDIFSPESNGELTVEPSASSDPPPVEDAISEVSP